ncbi:hypothetical protein BOTBODRAFT_192449 [Botryobasidium botryosum FD-172 SS1]|uniref:Uncharacterized protein n=1 Tax=Botryobasidium botryosum (strain FD-172 SS1) TaxID=930990 RepID=A0A067LVR4_BOTB1|nr:hypothetical protein BOTBODRAFT_192449 [Botryobasidium botryosum FD-172 SS1]
MQEFAASEYQATGTPAFRPRNDSHQGIHGPGALSTQTSTRQADATHTSKWLDITQGPPASDKCPVEVLSRIFELVVVAEESTWFPQPRALTWTAPLILLRICSRWRRIAMNTPRLWTRINALMLSDTLTDTFLRWSKSAPIDIAFPQYGKRDRFMTLVAQHVHRWRSLELKNLNLDAEEAIKLLQVPTPHLQSFHITLKGHAQLLEDLFAGVAPQLHTLKLSGLCLSLASPLFANLRVLNLTSMGRHILLISQLLSIIERSPLLEELVLHHRYFLLDHATETASPPNPSPIKLSHLGCLYLEMDIPAAQCIISRIITPPRSNLQLILHGPVPNHLNEIFPNSAASTHSLQNIPHAHDFRVVAQENLGGCSMRGNGPKGFFHIDFLGPSEPGFFNHILVNPGRALPMPALEELFLYIDDSVSVSTLTSFLADYPSVRMLALDGCREVLLEALLDRQQCPRLERLKIYAHQITDALLIRLVQSRSGPEMGSEVQDLGSGTPLQHVYLPECRGLSRATVLALQGYPCEVHLTEGDSSDDMSDRERAYN